VGHLVWLAAVALGVGMIVAVVLRPRTEAGTA